MASIVGKWPARLGIRTAMSVYIILLRMTGWLGPRKRDARTEGLVVLLTGTFYSDNWIESHLAPLAHASRCSRIIMVASSPVPSHDKVEPVYAPTWLRRLAGDIPSRLLQFFWVGLRIRPDYVGGFHILANGLAAVLLARMIGARSIYFNGGGATEVLGGGYQGNRVFGRLGAPDDVVERQLLRVVSAFDLVMVMGTKTIEFFKSRGIAANCRIEPVGKDERRFRPSASPKEFDLILVARLGQVKRVDLFLEAVALTARTIPEISAVIVGDGPLRVSLEATAARLGIEANVTFVGHQDKVETWLHKAKVVVLTSDSEGLPLSLIEAMMCGLPAVASKVGDISDLIQDGENGYLVSDRTPEAFGSCFVALLRRPSELREFSDAAIQSTLKYGLPNAGAAWNEIL